MCHSMTCENPATVYKACAHCSRETRKRRRRPVLRTALHRFTAGFGEQNFRHEQNRADDDGTVGNVEVRPTVTADVEVQEIHYTSCHHAVPKVSGRSTQN